MVEGVVVIIPLEQRHTGAAIAEEAVVEPSLRGGELLVKADQHAVLF